MRLTMSSCLEYKTPNNGFLQLGGQVNDMGNLQMNCVQKNIDDVVPINQSIETLMNRIEADPPEDFYQRHQAVLIHLLPEDDDCRRRALLRCFYGLDRAFAVHGTIRQVVSAFVYKVKVETGQTNIQVRDLVNRFSGHQYNEGDISKMLAVGGCIAKYPALSGIKNFNKIYAMSRLPDEVLAEVAATGKLAGIDDINKASPNKVMQAVKAQFALPAGDTIDAEHVVSLDGANGSQDYATCLLRLSRCMDDVLSQLPHHGRFQSVVGAMELLQEEIAKLNLDGAG
jgi:hypothetical protein